MSVVIDAGFTGIAQPLNQPRIAAYPLEADLLLDTTSGQPGFDNDFAIDGNTWTFWRPVFFPAQLVFNFASAQTFSYMALASHNCGTAGIQVIAQEWNGSAWLGIETHSPTDDGPILFLFANRTRTRARFVFNNAIPTIGIAMVGQIIELPRKAQFVGGAPFNERDQTIYSDTISDGGHRLERFARRRAQSVEMQVNNLSETWCKTVLEPLRRHMEGNPVFIADRPSVDPESVVFGMAPEPLQSERVLPRSGAARSATFRITGLGPVSA